MERIKAVFNWSGGKDSAHALLRAIESGRYEIVALLTTVNRESRRSTMHGIPLPLLRAQAARIGIPLHEVALTPAGDMADYAEAMRRTVVEPLWGRTSEEVMGEFLASGLRTVVVTTMADILGADAIGREIDPAFVASLPPNADPNGENGEYHTFCYDGPIFRSPVPFRLGDPFRRSYDVRLDDGSVRTYSYWFADLGAI